VFRFAFGWSVQKSWGFNRSCSLLLLRDTHPMLRDTRVPPAKSAAAAVRKCSRRSPRFSARRKAARSGGRDHNRCRCPLRNMRRVRCQERCRCCRLMVLISPCCTMHLQPTWRNKALLSNARLRNGRDNAKDFPEAPWPKNAVGYVNLLGQRSALCLRSKPNRNHTHHIYERNYASHLRIDANASHRRATWLCEICHQHS
jgi:hypothetical protein